MNRIERISAILVQLQSRRVVTATQMAESFQVSVRTIYRDIRVLEEIGIPIIGDVGVGYSLVDGYKLPPLMFERKEAIAFLTAEKMVEKMTDLQNVQSFKSGMNKIRALLRYLDQDYLSDIDDNIKVMGRDIQSSNLPFAVMQCILQSTTEKKQIKIEYVRPNHDPTVRVIEPIGCFHSSINWYLIAYCTLRNDYRNFRVDRILDYELTDVPFTKEHKSLSEFMDEFENSEDSVQVIIRVQASDIYFLENYRCYHGWLKEETVKDYVDVYLRVIDIDDFARWFLPFAHVAKIREPQYLEKRVKEMIDELSNLYEQ